MELPQRYGKLFKTLQKSEIFFSTVQQSAERHIKLNMPCFYRMHR